jgi:hypothetical protein
MVTMGTCSCGRAPMDTGVPGGRDDKPADSMQLHTECRPFDREFCERIAPPGFVLDLWATGLDASSPSSGRDPWGVRRRSDVTDSGNDRHRFVEAGPESTGPGRDSKPQPRCLPG